MMNYYERYQPDVVLAYNDLAKEAEAFGCGVKYSDYVVPSIETHVLEDKARPGPAARCPIPTGRRGCPASSSSARRSSRPSRPAAIGAVAVGPWTIAMLLRNPEMMLLDTFEDPQFIHDLMRLATDFCKLWGDAIVKTRIGLSFSEPTASISLISPGQLPGVHRALSQGAGGPLQGQEGGRDHPHLRHHLPDLRGPDRLRLHHDLVRPRPAGRSRAARGPARRGSWRWPRGARWPSATWTRPSSRRPRGREMEAEVRRCIDTAARHSGFILSTSCEIPPRSNPEIVKWFMDAAHDYGRYERMLARRRAGGAKTKGAVGSPPRPCCV